MENNIKHRIERIPGLIRSEVYELDDIVYTEQFDDASGARISGTVTMYNGMRVCGVNADGTLTTNIPTNWVVDRKDMILLKEDIERLDRFLCIVCEKYKRPN